MALVQDLEVTDSLSPLESLVVCPACRADLSVVEAGLECAECGRAYPVRAGIPDLAIFNDAPGFSLQSESAQFYQQKYTDDEASADYDRQFAENRHKQARTSRELEILGRLLGRVERAERLLNVPCGGGRLSAPLSRSCRTLVEADVSFNQVSYARANGTYEQRGLTGFVTASAFYAPFAAGSFDGVVCARLIHHFSASEDHERLLAELSRVARRFIILSFNDAASIKAISRRLRGRPNPMTLTLAGVARLAGAHDFHVDHTLSVSPFGSRHRYALLVRDG